MGLAHSPLTIVDGMTFCFDASNSKSVDSAINIGGYGTLAYNNTSFIDEYGGAIEFTGENNSQIDTNRKDIIPAGSTDYTLEAWYLNYGLSPTNRNYGVIFTNYGPGFTGSGQIWFFTSGLWHGSGYGYIGGGPGAGYGGHEYGVPRHIISTKSGSTYKTWYQGTLYTNNSSGVNNSASANVNWRIGNDVNSVNAEALYGKIYLIRAYNRALTDDEVLYNFNSTKGRFGF